MARSRLLVAVIDDDASVRKALARLLRASGHEVEAFASGGEFLESSKTGAPDCLVLDVHMPSVSGLDVQAALLARGIHVPIIFITAYDDNALRDRALEQGAVAYLRKPLTEQMLLAAIAKAVGPGRQP
ncbi:response regulator transcription factor [Sulfuricaulis sp.]|jgi:FixJ family two-component response regulator|uniref:response regulator transcription factor n=1 Tax=Sulfuricaulis sp. TaxID=2003553 RepID=UPI00355A97D7